MGFAVGKLDRLCQGKKGNFDVYAIAGDWFSDVNGKRGWVIQVVGWKTYSVVDGETHESEILIPGKIENTTDIITAPEKAIPPEKLGKAIYDAIAQWEKEESERV
jgi:hypothetical protein